ncbi:MAG: DEAD/DEAH box helicase [Xanthomonadales bacterium]|jgi:ATP-dependent Lhr-like helicase|nr:DEAD/DEAH box helicase [Xanthomonadales bacterium]
MATPVEQLTLPTGPVEADADPPVAQSPADRELGRLFSPAVSRWFRQAFPAPTPTQLDAWRSIRSGRDTLVAAPTGSGKTLAAFLCAIDDLVRARARAPLEDRVHVLYVSPLKALSNDIHRNLGDPLEGIEGELAAACEPASGIRAAVRTGDTPSGERAKMARRPPHILVTTPESLYLLLTSDSGRRMLGGVETVILDEIHAVAGNKRGAHLALSLARLDALIGVPPSRIGLSATQKPMNAIAGYLTGGGDCAIVDSGHHRDRDLRIELTESPLTPVMANEHWAEVYDRLAELVENHTTTLVFVNTRRLAERVARHLAERIGEHEVMAHHGSLSRKHRFESEQALKSGRLRVLVATASLELGIDVGSVDLVCQLGTPGSIAAFLQRVGRSGHQVGGTPKGRLFPTTRDDLVECVALLRAVEAGTLDAIVFNEAPLDVLAQQVVAEVSAREWRTADLLQAFRRAWPYRELEAADFHAVVSMLAEGYTTRRGRRGAWLFHDAVNGRLRARPAARLTALQNGGAIPDQFDYDVILLPGGQRIGSLGEDFSFDSVPGDIFQLGNASYRIIKTEQSRVLVEDAHGEPPTLPFWFGDRPGRSDELSEAVAGLREELVGHFSTGGPQRAFDALVDEGFGEPVVEQLVAYLHAAWQALDGLPTRNRVILERFFDDTGDMHLVLHATLGSRIMRAWGLSLRKRFCRQFNFELQAAALEDCLILSLGETHSFDLEEVMGYLKPESVEPTLVQALLDAPMFEARWRWNATIALAVQRMRNGKRLPAQWQRNQAEDLVSVVFPDQIACAENLSGHREVPDHPLVKQTIGDCLRETMDIDGLVRVLEALGEGGIEVRCADLTGPSPLAREVISARPYAFLDDGEAEERRTRAISGGPADLGQADTLRIVSRAARDQVRDEAWAQPRNPDELHDMLVQFGGLARAEYSTGNSLTGAPGDATRWPAWFSALRSEHRAACLVTSDEQRLWIAAERVPEWCSLHPEARLYPAIDAAPGTARDWDPDDALVALVRDRLAGLGPVTRAQLADALAVSEAAVDQALLRLQGQGYAVRMEQDDVKELWCERRLLARIHRYSRERRRQAVKPVPPEAYLRFLARWHALDNPASLDLALERLEGWAAPVACWLNALLRSRVAVPDAGTLDRHFLSGRLNWFRPPTARGEGRQVVAGSPVALVPRGHLDDWLQAGALPQPPAFEGSRAVERLVAVLRDGGATFQDDLVRATGLSEAEVQEGLRSLVYGGAVTADAFSPLLTLLTPESRKRRKGLKHSGAGLPIGRWSLLEAPAESDDGPGPQARRTERLATISLALLKRYGVVFRAVLQREPLLPPWRDLLHALRRLEDRGEVLGGRFVDGFSGEQFALPEAAGLLRQCQRPADNPAMAVLSGADPLNLGGILVPGPKTPALAAHRILLEDGLPTARLLGDTLETLPAANGGTRQRAEERLRTLTPFRR